MTDSTPTTAAPVLPGRDQREVILHAAKRMDDYADSRRDEPAMKFHRATAALLRSHGEAECTGERYGKCEQSGPLSCPEHYLAFRTACAYLGFTASEPLPREPKSA